MCGLNLSYHVLLRCSVLPTSTLVVTRPCSVMLRTAYHMPYYVLLCYVRPKYGLRRSVLLFTATYVLPSSALLCTAFLCPTTFWYVMYFLPLLYHVLFCSVMYDLPLLYHILLCYIMPPDAILRYVMYGLNLF